MTNNQYTYNQPPMGQGMPPRQMGMPRQMGAPRPRGWRERWMHRFGMDVASASLTKDELIIPQWVTGKAMVFFFIAMSTSWMAFGHVPSFDLWIVACITVVLFFYGGNALSKSWEHKKEKAFLKNVFIAGFIIRFIWVMYLYFVFNPTYYNNTLGNTADIEWYMPCR